MIFFTENKHVNDMSGELLIYVKSSFSANLRLTETSQEDMH